MTINSTLEKWHGMLERQDPSGLGEILHPEVIFHSPVVHTPQKGKDVTTLYLAAAFQVLGGEKFHYLREVVGATDAILEFETELDGIYLNGVDMMTCDENGLITDFKVMVRPLKAVNRVHQLMGDMLQKLGKSG